VFIYCTDKAGHHQQRSDTGVEGFTALNCATAGLAQYVCISKHAVMLCGQGCSLMLFASGCVALVMPGCLCQATCYRPHMSFE
jgi:hypothetical protein